MFQLACQAISAKTLLLVMDVVLEENTWVEQILKDRLLENISGEKKEFKIRVTWTFIGCITAHWRIPSLRHTKFSQSSTAFIIKVLCVRCLLNCFLCGQRRTGVGCRESNREVRQQ